MEDEIYLCTIQDLAGDANDDRATELMTLLGAILQKLGYQLASGRDPNFHELWALPNRAERAETVPEPPPSPSLSLLKGDLAADDFEARFLLWLRMFGITPIRQQGTNAAAWRFRYGDSDVSFVVVGQQKNTALPPSSHIAWLLRIEEAEPAPFITLVERYFAAGSGLRRRMPGGNTRIQFKSTALLQAFITQTNAT